MNYLIVLNPVDNTVGDITLLKSTSRVYDPVKIAKENSALLIDTEYHRLYAVDMTKLVSMFNSLHEQIYFPDIYIDKSGRDSLSNLYRFLLKFLEDDDHNKKYIYLLDILSCDNISTDHLKEYFDHVIREYIECSKENDEARSTKIVSDMVFLGIKEFIDLHYRNEPFVITKSGGVLKLQAPSGNYYIHVMKVN